MLQFSYKGNGEVKAMDLILHPQYNVKGLKDKNVNEFYDYDIALIRMRKNITISSQARYDSTSLSLGYIFRCLQHLKPVLMFKKGMWRTKIYCHFTVKCLIIH